MKPGIKRDLIGHLKFIFRFLISRGSYTTYSVVIVWQFIAAVIRAGLSTIYYDKFHFSKSYREICICCHLVDWKLADYLCLLRLRKNLVTYACLLFLLKGTCPTRCELVDTTRQSSRNCKISLALAIIFSMLQKGNRTEQWFCFFRLVQVVVAKAHWSISSFSCMNHLMVW